MKDDHVFYRLLDDVNKGFSGWDFSYISDTGRVRSSLLSWSYASLVIPHMQEATSMLDMGTGGGEFLAKLGHIRGMFLQRRAMDLMFQSQKSVWSHWM